MWLKGLASMDMAAGTSASTIIAVGQEEQTGSLPSQAVISVRAFHAVVSWICQQFSTSGIGGSWGITQPKV